MTLNDLISIKVPTFPHLLSYGEAAFMSMQSMCSIPCSRSIMFLPCPSRCPSWCLPLANKLAVGTPVQHCVSSILASLWEWWNFTSFHRRRLCWAESLGPWRTMNAVWSSSVLFKVSKRFNHGCTPVQHCVSSILASLWEMVKFYLLP